MQKTAQIEEKQICGKKYRSEQKWLSRIDDTNLFNEIQNIFIINELNVAPVNFFLCVLFLLHFKHML